MLSGFHFRKRMQSERGHGAVCVQTERWRTLQQEHDTMLRPELRCVQSWQLEAIFMDGMRWKPALN